MSDDTPTTPKRTRKRATAKVAPPDLVGVMAPDPDPAAEPEAAGTPPPPQKAPPTPHRGERARRRRGRRRAPRRVRPG